MVQIRLLIWQIERLHSFRLLLCLALGWLIPFLLVSTLECQKRERMMLTETVRYLPEWMPGTGFKKTSKEWHATLMAMAEKPMQFVKQEMAAKRNEPSFVSNIFEKQPQKDLDPQKHYVTKWAAASLYAGGADTVSRPARAF